MLSLVEILMNIKEHLENGNEEESLRHGPHPAWLAARKNWSYPKELVKTWSYNSNNKGLPVNMKPKVPWPLVSTWKSCRGNSSRLSVTFLVMPTKWKSRPQWHADRQREGINSTYALVKISIHSETRQNQVQCRKWP